MSDKELLKQADEFLEITRPTSLARVSGVSLVYKMKARLEELTADKEPKSIVWEPKINEEYFYIDSRGMVSRDAWWGFDYDHALLKNHNIYKTLELAKKAAQHQRRFNMVLQAVLNLEPDQKVDWGDEDQRKYQVYFCHAYKQWISPPYGAICTENGWPALTDKKNLQPLLDRLNAKEQENG